MDTIAPPVALLRAGLVISEYDPRSLLVLGRGDAIRIHLPRMPPDAWFTVAADFRGDRLFVISAGGVMGEVDRVAEKPRVTYHIDTRDWSTHAIAPAITDTTPIPYGVIAWNKSGAGLALYGASGKLRFRALPSQQVTDVEAGDHYAYATTTSGRFAINLGTGRVTGPLASTARLVPPSFGGPLPGCSWACQSQSLTFLAPTLMQRPAQELHSGTLAQPRVCRSCGARVG